MNVRISNKDRLTQTSFPEATKANVGPAEKREGSQVDDFVPSKAGQAAGNYAFSITKMDIKDGARARKHSVTVAAPSSAVTSLTLTLNVMHPRPEEALKVSLTSPSGQVTELTSSQLAELKKGPATFTLPAGLSSAVAGKWTLSIRDTDKKADQGMIHQAVLGVVTDDASPIKYVRPPLYEAMTSKQLTRLTELHDTFMTPHHLQMHAGWHEANGSGGTRGPGSGELFLLFHHQMMNEFGTHLMANGEAGLVPIPIWDPTKPIPKEIRNSKAHRDNENPQISKPTWLTLEGGTLTAPGDIPGIRGLKDVKSLDDLGRILGTSGYHGSAHNKIGGTMASFGSPQDPVFFGWHGHIDDIMMQWLTQTDAGKAWLKVNEAKLNAPHVMMARGQHNIHREVTQPVDLNGLIDSADTEWRELNGFPPLDML